MKKIIIIFIVAVLCMSCWAQENSDSKWSAIIDLGIDFPNMVYKPDFDGKLMPNIETSGAGLNLGANLISKKTNIFVPLSTSFDVVVSDDLASNGDNTAGFRWDLSAGLG